MTMTCRQPDSPPQVDCVGFPHRAPLYLLTYLLLLTSRSTALASLIEPLGLTGYLQVPSPHHTRHPPSDQVEPNGRAKSRQVSSDLLGGAALAATSALLLIAWTLCWPASKDVERSRRPQSHRKKPPGASVIGSVTGAVMGTVMGAVYSVLTVLDLWWLCRSCRKRRREERTAVAGIRR